jgi:hypothetical protein
MRYFLQIYITVSQKFQFVPLTKHTSSKQIPRGIARMGFTGAVASSGRLQGVAKWA